MRLDKYLSEMGCGTRSELKKNIKSGLVTVDGAVVKDPGTRVTPDSCVTYRGETVIYEEYVYYMLNKPAGVISATEDSREDTVVDLIDETRRRGLFPAGRLDRDTEGLLIITNDGELAHRLLSPKHHVDKKYFAILDGIADEDDIDVFSEGIVLPDGLACLPADLTILSVDEEADSSEIEITIREGKFHQIKRMFSAIGMQVLYLKRLTMGPLDLDPSLEPGEYRRLTDDEITMLKSV